MPNEYTAPFAAAQQVFSNPMLGHNLPPFDLGAFIDRVIDAPLTASEKLIQIVLARLAQKNGGTVAPKRADVLAKASCSEATFKRSFGLLRNFFEVEKRKGTTTQYSVKPIPTHDEIAEAVAGWKHETKDHSEPGIKTKGHSDTKKVGITEHPGSKAPPLPDTEPKESFPHTPFKEITTLHWRTREGQDELTDKLLAACNGAAANPAIAPGILVLAEPIRWLENGCDLELDILPTVRARAHKLRPGSIKNWSYFTTPIADAKAAREAPMPKGSPGAATAKPGKPQGNYSFSGEYIGRRL